MSIINPGNNIQFKSVDSLFGRIRKRLSSYDAAGLLDEGDWYYYIREIIDKLGVAVYDEREAVVQVCDFRASLPEDFSFLYAAYKCTPDNGGDSKNTLFPQTGFVFYIEDTYQPYRKCKNCYSAKIDYIHGTKFTTRTYIEGQPMLLNFNNPTLLQLSGNAKGMCDSKCKNLFAKSAHEITIDKNFIYTNFKQDCILLKYYGLPLDPETGLPMIPDNSIIAKAIEDYIVYRTFSDFFYNSTTPDANDRYKQSSIDFDESYANARSLCKMPSFQSVINHIRQERKNLRTYFQLEW